MKKINVLKKASLVAVTSVSILGLAACDEKEAPSVEVPNVEVPQNADSYYSYNTDYTASLGMNDVDFTYLGYEERAEALGQLEKFAVENYLTGITLYEAGNYAMYNPRLTFGASSYVPGYGWGTITEGNITAPLTTQANTDWQMYYHSYEEDDPASINYMDDKGSVVSSLNSYISSSYWTTELNSTRDGYEWVNQLAKEKPQAVNPDSVTGLSTTYKFEVTQDLKYSTLSENSTFSAFNGRSVQLEDYLTPYKEMHNQKNGLARAADSLTSGSSIAGLNDYYEATSNGFDQAAWDNVGLKATEENGKWYITATFNQAQNSFYAMYYLASILYTPIPADFVSACGGIANVGKFNSNSTLTPVDTSLSTGQFVVEEWNNDVEIVFKKNDKFVADKDGYYNIEGVHLNILSAANTDSEAGFKEFIAGKIDSASIPSTQLATYKTDPRTQHIVGGQTTKLNLNTCTQEEWEYYFGVNGIVVQTPLEEYWDVEPAMSNNDFLSGLSYAIDRQTYAANRGSGASCSFFGSTYLSDPENGIIYNNTDYHEDAISSLVEGTDGYGYSLTLAKASFQKAAADLIASGAYSKGDTITLDMVWQAESNITYYGDEIAAYFDAAWSGITDLKLEVNNIVPAIWTDAYYAHMLVGQYDIAFGSISGSSLNPLSFFDNLMSSNPNNFTLNYGSNTALVSDDIFFAGRNWSFDALFLAFDEGVKVNSEGAVFEEGVDEEFDYNFLLSSSTHNLESGVRTVAFTYAIAEGASLTNLKAVVTVDGEEVELDVEVVNGKIVVTVPENIATTMNSVSLKLTSVITNTGEADVNASYTVTLQLKK